jgi:hypothetical protein
MLMATLAGLVLSGAALAHGGGPGSEEFEAAKSAAFAEADTDGDGKLTLAEFTTFHELLREKLDATRFAALDTDGDGAVSEAELDAGKPAGKAFRRSRRGF